MAKYTGRIEIFFNSEKDAEHFAHVIDSMSNLSEAYYMTFMRSSFDLDDDIPDLDHDCVVYLKSDPYWEGLYDERFEDDDEEEE